MFCTLGSAEAAIDDTLVETGAVATVAVGAIVVFMGLKRPFAGQSTERKYGFPEGNDSIWNPVNFAFASSVFTGGPTMTRSPYFQSTGVARPLSAVSWRDVRTRSTSSKFLPVVAG